MRRVLTSAALAAALLTAPAASAGGGVQLKGLDSTGYPTIRLTVVTSSALTKPPAVTENGQRVVGLQAENLGRAKNVVLAIDRSRSMKGQALIDATAAARAFVSAKPENDLLALVAFGDQAELLTRFSSATIDADSALRRMSVAAHQGTALYDAVDLAARAHGDQPLTGRVIILLTDGRDQGSSAPLKAAIESARRAGAVVYSVAIVGPDFDAGPLQRLARETGGSYYPAPSTAALAGIYSSIAQELSRTWRLQYMTTARPGDDLRVKATVAGVGSASGALVIPGRPGMTSAPLAKPSPLVPAHFYTSGAGTLLLALTVGFLCLLAAGIALAAKKGAWLRTRLDAHVMTQKRGKGKQVQERERLAAAAGLFRATERAFGHLAPWKKIQRLLERADLPIRTVEFVYIMGGSGFVLGLLAAASGSSAPVILGAFGIGGCAPYGFLWFKANRRLNAIENQLPDLLITLAASLKAGHSFRQGIQTVVDEGQPPASEEFKRVLAETRLGRPMDDALAEMAERVGSKNLEFVITAVTIQRQVGGSLAGLFDMVAEAVRNRQQFARKIKSLTAMGRMSAYVLIGLPFFIAGALTLMNPSYMDPLYHTSTGHKLIILGLLMMTFGTLILKKIVSFKG
jgi:tight adherence protein B